RVRDAGSGFLYRPGARGPGSCRGRPLSQRARALSGLPKGSIGPEYALTGLGTEIRIRGSFFAEGYPSGQREQTVNLPAYAFVGSNPTPSTRRGRTRSRQFAMVRMSTSSSSKAGVVQ